MKRAAVVIARLLLGGLFLAAGLSKIGSPLQTLAAIYSYQIVIPDWLANTIAHGWKSFSASDLSPDCGCQSRLAAQQQSLPF